ncbi:hypothetical protein [Streptomyces chartreusis]
MIVDDTPHGMKRVFADVRAERARQDEQWGEQNHPDGTGGAGRRYLADIARSSCQAAAEAGTLTWRHIAREEDAEAFAESDPEKLRAELIQAIAVHVAWVEALDRRAEEAKCKSCHGRGYVPDFTNWDEHHGEPKAKPCPDCQGEP